MYYLKNKDSIKNRVKEYSKTDSGKNTHKKALSVWKTNNTSKVKASKFLNNYLRYNDIRPIECSLCGNDKLKIEAHHWSYLEVHWLDVVWCCSQCHSDIHNDKPQDIMRRQNSVVLNHINTIFEIN